MVDIKKKQKKYFIKLQKKTTLNLFIQIFRSETQNLTDYQQENINTSICVINELKKNGWKISKQQIDNGIDAAINKNPIIGRWQILDLKPKVYR